MALVFIPVLLIGYYQQTGNAWLFAFLLADLSINGLFSLLSRYPVGSWRDLGRGATRTFRVVTVRPCERTGSWFAYGQPRPVCLVDLIDESGMAYEWAVFLPWRPGFVHIGQELPILVTRNGWSYALTHPRWLPYRSLQLVAAPERSNDSPNQT